MSDENAIKDLLEARARVIGNKDAGAAVGFYANDIVNFDLAPPLAYRGRAATDPAELQGWFDTWDGPIALEFDQLEIRATDDLGLAFGFLHMTGTRTDGSRTDIWARFTAGLERRSGEWMIVHEHQSFPTMMDGSGRSASDLQPG
jgi:ketosteroid isomerase-like protein